MGFSKSRSMNSNRPGCPMSAEIGVSGPKDMGGLMKAVLPKVRGVAANNVVSQQVRKYLDAK